MSTYEILAEVHRGRSLDGELVDSRVESVHFGIVVVSTEDGQILRSHGDPKHRTYIRSAAKPFQVLPLIESGGLEHFGFTPRQCAVICASHNGEPVHTEAVQAILNCIGLTPNDLQCGAHAPYHGPTADLLLQNGETFTTLHNNCSGKHAGMLAYCVHNRLPVQNYLDFDHPLQQEILRHVEEHSGERNVPRGTDGCSAPVFFLEMQGMARMFARLAAHRTSALKRSFEILRAEPYMVGGKDRFDTDLMLNSGVVAKVGGEGIECVGIPASESRPALGIAVKIADGNFRALYPVVTSLLKTYGALNDEQLSRLSSYHRTPMRNHMKKLIGHITCALPL